MLMQSCVTVPEVWQLPPLLVYPNDSPVYSHFPLCPLATCTGVTEPAEELIS